MLSVTITWIYSWYVKILCSKMQTTNWDCHKSLDFKMVQDWFTLLHLKLLFLHPQGKVDKLPKLIINWAQILRGRGNKLKFDTRCTVWIFESYVLVMGRIPFFEHRMKLTIIFQTWNRLEYVYILARYFRLQMDTHQISNLVQPITRFTKLLIKKTQKYFFLTSKGL